MAKGKNASFLGPIVHFSLLPLCCVDHVSVLLSDCITSPKKGISIPGYCTEDNVYFSTDQTVFKAMGASLLERTSPML